jgi:hypothetical protein
MAGEKRRHALDRGKTNLAATSQIACTSNAASNALFTRFLRRQASFAMFLS